MKKTTVIANWKMNVLPSQAAMLARTTARFSAKSAHALSIVLCPSPESISSVKHALGHPSKVMIGAQNCASEPSGAFTGESSARSLKQAGCSLVLIGHSERRAILGEEDATISKKFRMALQARLIPVLCIGETRDERSRGTTHRVLKRQLSIALEGAPPSCRHVLIAYEPVWAIGHGTPLVPNEFKAVRNFIQDTVRGLIGAALPVLYGGSVVPESAGEYAAVGDGVLVGGASQTPRSFSRLLALL